MNNFSVLSHQIIENDPFNDLKHRFIFSSRYFDEPFWNSKVSLDHIFQAFAELLLL